MIENLWEKQRILTEYKKKKKYHNVILPYNNKICNETFSIYLISHHDVILLLCSTSILFFDNSNKYHNVTLRGGL